MLYIFLRALSNTLFAQLLRLGQARRPQTLGLITVNYLVAALVSLLLAGLHGRVRFLPPTVNLGVLGGTAYIVSILLLMPAMQRSGVSVAVAVLQLSILWPIAYAMVAFREMPSGGQWVGMAAALVALVLLSAGRTSPLAGRAPGPGRGHHLIVPVRTPLSHSTQKASGWFSPVLLMLFFVTGISGIAMKAFHEFAPAQELPGFMVVLFATATVGGALAMALRRVPLEWGDLALGAAIGLPNAAQLEFLLRAMETVPAIVVFPVSAALALVMNAVAAILWWGERLDRATALGLALTLAATVLLNRG
jgi:drug/metabolite transporter (DMT)-like permease